MVQGQEPFGGSQSFCTSCGRSIANNALYCPHCGAATPTAGAQPAAGPASGARLVGRPYTHVPNYLVQAILVTVFCCLPFGIVAIVYAAQVNGKLASGDYTGAVNTSRTAKTWCWVSFGGGGGARPHVARIWGVRRRAWSIVECTRTLPASHGPPNGRWIRAG